MLATLCKPGMVGPVTLTAAAEMHRSHRLFGQLVAAERPTHLRPSYALNQGTAKQDTGIASFGEAGSCHLW